MRSPSGSAALPAAAFVRSIREGRPLAEGSALCRSTLTAVLGREAATAGVARAWTDIAPPPESA
jgi:hypothetical protein